jgi:two-component system sensor kinase
MAAPMGIPIRVLLVEDSRDDAELILRQLRLGGFDPWSARVQTAEAMKQALQGEAWDLVVCDHSMPSFDAAEALDLLKQSGHDLPFIVVSGSIGEDTAVAMMKAGAHDYLMKQNLARLIPAVKRELSEAEIRRQRELAVRAKERLEAERDDLLERLRLENQESKRAADALMQSESALRAVLESALDCVITMSQEGTIIEFNPAAERTFRYSRAEAQGRDLADLIVPEAMRERHRRGLAHHLATGEGRILHQRVEMSATRNGGEEFPIELTITRIPGSEPPVFAGFIRDITGSRQAKDALRASEQRFKSIFETEPECVKLVGKDGFLLEMNAAGLAMLEATSLDDVKSRPLTEFLLPEYRAGFVALHQSAMAGGIGRLEFEIVGLRGTRRWLETHAAPIRDGMGAVTMMIGVTRDITDRKRSDQALIASLHEKEALLKEVHHRVKNNLQVITSLLRLEAGRDVEPSTKSVLKEMQGRIQSMALLHEALYRSGTFASVDLGAYLKQLAGQSFRTLVAEPGVIQLHVDAAPVRVDMDQAMPCGLIVNELISNCLKHGFPDGRAGEVRVDLLAIDGGEEIHLRVSDTGVGLPENYDVAHSTSLGLRLVSDLARQLQGTLSIGPGPGTSMELKFRPAMPQPEREPAPPSDPGPTHP